MRKKLLTLVSLLTIPGLVLATQRVMVMEKFTATWCTYCPGAARGAEELQFRAFDSVVVIAYHPSSSDPFYTATAASRRSYYGVSGYPTMKLDGNYEVVGGLHYGTMYPTYRQYFDTRKTVPSPLDIALAVNYDSLTRYGTLTIVVRNTSGAAVSGQLHTVLIESHIYYPWQGMDSLHDVERTMLPNASGEGITVPAGDSVVRTRNFTVNTGWVAKNCAFVVFVQNNASREIYQGARIEVISEPALEFVGYQPVLPRPGESFNLTVGVRNIGGAPAPGASAVLTTADPYLTITNPNTTFGTIGVGADVYAQSPFVVQVSSGCPDPHLATLQVVITSTDATVDTFTFPINITTSPGFADDMEHGEGNWTHGGIRDNWHLSNYRSSSPSYSWYCGVEANRQYTNENDARLLTPFFTVGESAWVRFQHYYATEAGYDFCLVDVNNGSPFWRALGSWHGSSGGWQTVNIDLSSFQGQTVQLRFRFISDYNVTGEGWYIDNFSCGLPVGIAERRDLAQPGVVLVTNPVSRHARIRYALPAGRPARVAVYDAGGRLVRELDGGSGARGVIDWSLKDQGGRRVGAGTYFVRLFSGEDAFTVPVVVVR